MTVIVACSPFFADRLPTTSAAKPWLKASPRIPSHPINPKHIQQFATRSITPMNFPNPRKRSAACSTKSKRSSLPAPRRRLMLLPASPSTCSTILQSCVAYSKSFKISISHLQGQLAGETWSNYRISPVFCSKGFVFPMVWLCVYRGLRPIGSSGIETLIFLLVYVYE